MERTLEKYQIIERSIITTYRKRLWSKFTKAIKEYKLIEPGDSICVCISGGKDSFIMAKLFMEISKHTHIPFTVKYLVMNPGYNPANLQRIKDNLQIMNIPAQIVDTNIFNVAYGMEKNACYICAKMRRGALYNLAQNMGCNKIALGHHYDDVIETTLMNMLQAGSFQTMLPKLKSQNYNGMELIRPLYLIREKDIIAFCEAHELKFLRCACPFTEEVDKHKEESASQRYQTKLLIQRLLELNPNVEKNIFKAASNVNLDMILGYKTGGKTYNYLDNYNKENKHESTTFKTRRQSCNSKPI